MLVDYERVLLRLKEHIAGKSHHGQRELFAVLAQAEVDHRIEEGLPERALRLYGLEFFEEAIADRPPRSDLGRVSGREGDQDHASRGDSPIESKEDTHAGRSNPGHSPPSEGSVTAFRRRAARGA